MDSLMPEARAISLVVVPLNPFWENNCLETLMIWARRSAAVIFAGRALGLGSSDGFDQFDGFLKVARFGIAVVNRSLFLGRFFQQIACAALRTGFVDWLIPGSKVAVGVLIATVEYLGAA